jgi:hypothetical protein
MVTRSLFSAAGVYVGLAIFLVERLDLGIGRVIVISNPDERLSVW